jgi:hypothetical protein
MVLAIIFPRDRFLPVVAVAGIYVAIAIILGARRMWKEANNVFALQDARIKMLQEDVDTHPGDVTYEVDRAREYHRQQSLSIAYFDEKRVAQFERELWQRDERISQLEAEVQRQIAFIQELQRRDRPIDPT